MTEIESIENRIPTGMQLERNQLQRDFLVARAKRERSEYIASAIRKLARSLRQLLVPARGDDDRRATLTLRQQQ